MRLSQKAAILETLDIFKKSTWTLSLMCFIE